MKINLKKIFLMPPKSLRERMILFFMLLISFMVFFQPLKFSDLHPAEAFILSAMPALSISWGWIVLLRMMFRRSEFLIDGSDVKTQIK